MKTAVSFLPEGDRSRMSSSCEKRRGRLQATAADELQDEQDGEGYTLLSKLYVPAESQAIL